MEKASPCSPYMEMREDFIFQAFVKTSLPLGSQEALTSSYSHIPASLSSCIPVAPHPRFPASQHPSISAPLHPFLPTPQHPRITTSLISHIPTSLHLRILASLYPHSPSAPSTGGAHLSDATHLRKNGLSSRHSPQWVPWEHWFDYFCPRNSTVTIGCFYVTYFPLKD